VEILHEALTLVEGDRSSCKLCLLEAALLIPTTAKTDFVSVRQSLKTSADRTKLSEGTDLKMNRVQRKLKLEGLSGLLLAPSKDW